MTLMLYIDAGKNNQGFNVMLTPRFLGGNNIRMGSPNLPPVGTNVGRTISVGREQGWSA